MMGFDTLKLSKQLAEAGMDSRQAEVLAQSFADILASKILDGQFATKQDLKNAFAEQMKEIESRFATKQDLKNAFIEQDKKLEVRFADIEVRFATKGDLKADFAAFSELIEARFAEMEERLHRQLMQSQFVLLAIMLAALGLATTLILMN